MTDPSEMYADIMHRHPPRPVNRVPMSRADRAAQFSAFAALSGHSEAIHETARLTDARPELSDCAKADIDAKLRLLVQRPGADVSLRRFENDPLKEGGTCYTQVCTVQRVDTARRCLELADGRTVALDDILALELL